MYHLNYIAALTAFLLMTTDASAQDLSSPRAAFEAVKSAYQSKNLELAIAAHDFHVEAEVMLERIAVQKQWPAPPTAELVAETAEVLELSFRKAIATHGFPNFNELKCTVIEEKPLQEGIVMLAEKCTSPDGAESTQRVFFALRDQKWRVFNIPTK